MDYKKYILGIIFFIALTGCSYLIYTKYKLVNQNTSPAILSNIKYQEANSLLGQGNFNEAERLFNELEEKNKNNMQDLAQLKLKKIQLLLAQKKYNEAINELNSILTGPFPKTIQSRAVENVFTTYFGSGQDQQKIYNLIFSSPNFSRFAATSTNESMYNYAEYGYNIYPSTVFGAAIIYGKLDKLSKTNQQQVDDLRNFVAEFITNSDKEINVLKQFPNQEITLINIYTERARVIHKTANITGDIDASVKIEENFYSALSQAQKMQNPFYVFYTTYNYIDYTANGVISARVAAEPLISNPSIFEIANVPEEWYRTTIRNVSTWSDKRKAAITKTNLTLGKLIEYYK